MTVKQFEDLQVWQAAKQLAVVIYKTTEKERFKKDYGLKDQLRRASISIVSNIAEGFERNGYKEFAYFLNLAKGSAGELRAQLHVAKELNYIDDEEFAALVAEATRISKMTYKLINYLRTMVTNRTGNVKEDPAIYDIQNL